MKSIFIFLIVIYAVIILSFQNNTASDYSDHYLTNLSAFREQQIKLCALVSGSDLSNPSALETIKKEIAHSRRKLKSLDFRLRYLEPTTYKKINGPLPVEWESEVFEKFEKPYKREGAGLSLAELYLEENKPQKDSLHKLLISSLKAIDIYKEDSITKHLKNHATFFLCNRLFLLNLAAIYTTGFECPDPQRIIPELKNMLGDVKNIYKAYGRSFSKFQLSEKYNALYEQTISFVNRQPDDFTKFDHFTFLKEYANPLFALNQEFIRGYNIGSLSYVDYTLNNNVSSFFDKSLFFAQNTKGIYSRVKDEALLKEIEALGKLLFYDPILSANDLRSCASCHKPEQYFTDTIAKTALQFNRRDLLPRNTPSLLNSAYNHLLMLDGKHLTLQAQAKDVMINLKEMGGEKTEILKKVFACSDYKKKFSKLLKQTPQEKEITLDHIVSAITYYYGKFGKYYSPFDEALNNSKKISEDGMKGFNLFMSKAQCATCHFVPHFSGIKPPYIGNEFEVLGVPGDRKFSELSKDKGRYEINPAAETLNAFRTTTIRNSSRTKPYMHNGVFNTLKEVIDFYDSGGGLGKKLNVSNQTLSADSLHLTETEKKQLITFIELLNENIEFDSPPVQLPRSKNKLSNTRKVGGEY